MLLGAVLVGTLAVVLSMHVEDLHDGPLSPEPPDWILTAVPLQPVPGLTVQRLRLYPSDVQVVTGRQELDLAFATNGKRVPITVGTLSVGGCVFSVRPGTRVENNAHVRFIRSSQCAEKTGSGPGVMALTMSVPSGDPLIVWTSRPPVATSSPDFIFVDGPADGVTPRLVLRGRYVDLRAPSRVRRVHLLNYLWQFTPYPYWIGGVLAVAGLLFSTGAFLVFRSLAGQRVPTTVGLGAACLALCLGILYAVLIPPFEAPDEPDHFLAFADMAARPELSPRAADLARIGHLERIKFNRYERFRPVDVGRPYAAPWNADIFPMPIAGRSRTTQALWWCVSKVTLGFDAPGTLLALRLANAMVFALAIGAGVGLLAAHSAATGAFIVSLGFFLVPTLPFFGVHVSEFAALTSTYIAFASVLAALFLDGPSTDRLGLPLGILTALMIAGGRSGAPMLALVGAALVGRALLGTRGTLLRREAVRRAAVFWVGAALGVSLLIPATGEAYSRGLWPGDTGSLPAWFRSAAEGVRDRSWVLALLLPLGVVVELAAGEVRRVAHDCLKRARALAVRSVAYVVAAAIVATATVSLTIDLPVIAYFSPASRPPLHDYLQATLSSLGTLARLRHHDLLLSRFFWTGFGWLDTLLPISVVTALVAVAGALGVWLLMVIGRASDERRGALLALLTGGWTATVALSTIGSYFLHRNLHGRYLVGAYLSSLAIVWTAPIVRRLTARRPAQVSWRVMAIALAACCAVHAFTLNVILRRYF